MIRNHAMRRARAGSIATVSTLAFASLGSAAEVVRMSHRDLAEKAEVIVEGRVKTAHARAGSGAYIFTDITLDVTAFVKSGDATQKTFSFSAIGGTLDDGRTFNFSGNTKYTVGEDVLLFLETPHPQLGYRHTIGMAQGKFSVHKDDTGRAYLERDLGGLSFADAHGPAKEPDKTSAPRLYKDDFLKEIKGYLEAKK